VARHNKKRNVGLIYELLIQRLSKAVVEGDKKNITVIEGIIHSRFKKGTELYKEFRLFNALVTTNTVSEQLAYRILNEAKIASVDHDKKKLDKEKSLLIKDVNHKINETTFYDKKVENYTVYASAQQLFNLWRDKEANIVEVAKHEATVHTWLIREDDRKELLEHKTPDVNDLTLQVMKDKFEAKYGASLNPYQQNLLRFYCEGNKTKLNQLITELSTSISRQIDRYAKKSGDKFLVEKVISTKNIISSHDTSCDIDGVSRAMMIAQLSEELREL